MHVFYVCICTCSVQLKMFHMERRSRIQLLLSLREIIVTAVLLTVSKTLNIGMHSDVSFMSQFGSNLVWGPE